MCLAAQRSLKIAGSSTKSCAVHERGEKMVSRETGQWTLFDRNGSHCQKGGAAKSASSPAQSRCGVKSKKQYQVRVLHNVLRAFGVITWMSGTDARPRADPRTGQIV